MAKQRMNSKSELKNFGEVSEAIKSIAKHELDIKKLESDRDTEKLKIENRFGKRIKDRKDKIKTLEKEISKFVKSKKVAFHSNRSMKLLFGTVGFRNGKPTLNKKKSITWEVVRDKLEELTGLKYIKVEKKLKKQEVLNAYDENQISDEVLKEAGCEVKQKKDEVYYMINWPEIKKSGK